MQPDDSKLLLVLYSPHKVSHEEHGDRLLGVVLEVVGLPYELRDDSCRGIFKEQTGFHGVPFVMPWAAAYLRHSSSTSLYEAAGVS